MIFFFYRQWASASNYNGDYDLFMRNEVRLAAEDGLSGAQNGFLLGLREHDPGVLDPAGGFSSIHYKWGNRPFTLAVKDLNGCTSVIAASRAGVYINHIWEAPGFHPNMELTGPNNEYIIFNWQSYQMPTDAEQMEWFKAAVLKPMRRGDGQPGGWNRYGLKDLREQGLFGSNLDTKAWLVAPFQRILDQADPRYDVEDPSMPLMFSHNNIRVFQPDRDGPSFNQRISKEIRDSLGGCPVTAVGYTTRNTARSDDDYETHRGKVMIQYQPAREDSKGSKAKYRIFFEGAEVSNPLSCCWYDQVR